MTKYYRSRYTGKIFTKRFASILDDIYGPGCFDYDITIGNLIPIEPPSLVDCIKDGNDRLAVFRYREIYKGTSWDDARNAIVLLKKDVMKTIAK